MFGDSAYEVLGLEVGASRADVQAAYNRGLKAAQRDRELRDRLSLARNALSRPRERQVAELLTPLPGALPSNASSELLAEARRHMSHVAPLMPDPASFAPPTD
ncbi:hypothetical protein OIE62_10450 [Streptomyces scopuliridis]|uniref:Uncharacterized protein n=2 Tax=Streptomyces TaxID=1883 RepID=A0ACD4ZS00_9ACTN|nr:hypothetical protein [Streptomyces scopuliridis]WSC00985.1 hypothetical protein OG835_30945 [Streptomyces scopuliridis]WSC05405.1 hypothetical protein OIE62_10450 [Streptomyces scopuliridis]